MKLSLIALALIPAICLLSGCKGRSAESILPDDIEFLPGDVVLRQGNGMTSRVVMMADKGGIYSHVGIVADSAGVMMICHAVPGEPDFEGDEDRVKLDSPDRFFNGINADCGCLLRHPDAQTARRASEIAMNVYRRKALFDHDYNEEDTVDMYCCELVEHAYKQAGCRLLGNERHRFVAPGLNFESLILPSDFLKSSKLKRLKEF